MAFTCGFFNSVNGDRRYNSRQISQIFDGIIVDGVFAHYGTHFEITPLEGMEINVGEGRFWFNHVWGLNDGNTVVHLDPADVSSQRKDAVIIEIDESDDVRNAFIKVLKGDFYGNNPTLINTDDFHQYPLAYVTVPAGATAVDAANIQVVVGTSECPFATGVLENVSIDNLFNQWDAQFQEWFSSIQGQLEGDVLTNLVGQIEELKSSKASKEDVEEISEGVLTVNGKNVELYEDGAWFTYYPSENSQWWYAVFPDLRNKGHLLGIDCSGPSSPFTFYINVDTTPMLHTTSNIYAPISSSDMYGNYKTTCVGLNMVSNRSNDSILSCTMLDYYFDPDSKYMAIIKNQTGSSDTCNICIFNRETYEVVNTNVTWANRYSNRCIYYMGFIENWHIFIENGSSSASNRSYYSLDIISVSADGSMYQTLNVKNVNWGTYDTPDPYQLVSGEMPNVVYAISPYNSIFSKIVYNPSSNTVTTVTIPLQSAEFSSRNIGILYRDETCLLLVSTYNSQAYTYYKYRFATGEFVSINFSRNILRYIKTIDNNIGLFFESSSNNSQFPNNIIGINMSTFEMIFSSLPKNADVKVSNFNGMVYAIGHIYNYSYAPSLKVCTLPEDQNITVNQRRAMLFTSRYNTFIIYLIQHQGYEFEYKWVTSTYGDMTYATANSTYNFATGSGINSQTYSIGDILYPYIYTDCPDTFIFSCNDTVFGVKELYGINEISGYKERLVNVNDLIYNSNGFYKLRSSEGY